MTLTELSEIDEKVIGSKQSFKALKRKQVKKLFIADDAEVKVIRPLVDLAEKTTVPVEKITSMLELGQAAGIEIGTAAVAILKV